MRFTGLKSHILITLALLLATAMLLADLVITMFWQQSLLRGEVQKITTILALESRHLAATNTGGRQGVGPAAAARLLREVLGAECVIALDSGGATFAEPAACPQAEELTKAIRESVAGRGPVAAPLGSTWDLFSARPESLIVALPLQATPAPGGIGALTSLDPLYAQVRQKQKAIFVYLLVNILLLGIIGFFRLVKSTVRPVERLVQQTEAYDDGESLLVTDHEASEFGQLSSALNRMTRRIDDDRTRLRESVASLASANQRLQQAQQDMIRAEKLAAVGRLSAGLAHEIGNPIGIVQGYLELLQRDNVSLDDRLQYSQRAISELDRINRLIRQLLDFARTSPPGTHPVAMHPLIRSLVDMFKNRKKMDRIAFRLDLDAPNDLVAANEESIRQVLLNCLLNSVDAISEKGENFAGQIALATRIPEGSETGGLEIAIRDNGCGIDSSQINNIFDPFFTTKEPGKGTGLGLAVSLAIVEAAGGRIRVESEPGSGTAVRITLPFAG